MNVQTYSCDFCRKRKLRCSRETPTCDKCIRYKKICSYSPKNKRMSLTKASFFELQARVEMLEKALKVAIPDQIERHNLLDKVNHEHSESNGKIKRKPMPPGELDGDTVGIHEGLYHDFDDHEDTYEKFLEDEYLAADNIEDIEELVWYENDDDDYDLNLTMLDNLLHKKLIDGMSALSIGNSNNLKVPIYYGLSSPNGLLKYLQKSNLNAQKLLLENYKPVEKAVDYKILLDEIKKLFGEFYLDNIAFHLVLFESYFATFHTAYPIINKTSFYQDYYNLANKSSINQIKALKILIYTILAMGAYFKYGDDSIIDLLYYKRIKQEIKDIDIMEYNSFYLLEALTLLGNYCQKRNKPNTGWNYHGICFRMAISFGLHKEVNLDKLNLTDKNIEVLERRRRLFWALYILDVGHSITLGRPSICPNINAVNIGLPSIDYNHDNLNLSLNLNINLNDSININPSVMDGFIQEIHLIKISVRVNNIMTDVNYNSNIKKINDLLEYNKDLDKLIDDLPPFFKDSSIQNLPKWFLFRRFKLIWRCRNLQTLMFRNYIWQLNKNGNKYNNHHNNHNNGGINSNHGSNNNSPNTLNKEQLLINECVNICTTIALDTIKSINEFIKQHETDVFTSWYAIYFIFHAVLVPILLIHNSKSNYSVEELEKFDYYIKLSKDTLNMLSPLNRMTCNLINLVEILSKSLGDDELLIDEIFSHDLNNFDFDMNKAFTGEFNDINFNLVNESH